jgi:hypothetical protein
MERRVFRPGVALGLKTQGSITAKSEVRGQRSVGSRKLIEHGELMLS